MRKRKQAQFCGFSLSLLIPTVFWDMIGLQNIQVEEQKSNQRIKIVI